MSSNLSKHGLSKHQALKLVAEKAPEYVEFFKEFQAHDGGWLVWPERMLRIKANLKLDSYVTLYEDEKRIDACLMLFLMGREGVEEFNAEYEKLDEPGKAKFIADFTQEVMEDDLKWLEDALGEWPPTPEKEAEALAAFKALPDEDQKKAILHLTYLFLHLFSSIHNLFAVMVCGQKMTSLVPKAIAGDDEAFCLAVKIDRNLLTSHPYFIERYQKAQALAERDFLKRLTYHQISPGLLGKIQYPGLYIVFAMLDVLGWLNDLTHSEILDICDAARLDRWQNRIEDVNYVTKRLAGYRRYQMTGGVSMH